MDDGLLFVGGEGRLFDNVVKHTGASNFFESKFRLGLVGCHQGYRADAEKIIENASA